MAEDFYVVERLVIKVLNEQRLPGPSADLVQVLVDLTVKNPIGPLDRTRRPPGMELRDAQGGVYTPVNSDWAEPVLPDTEMDCRVIFETPADATDLLLVLAPGDPEEVQIPLTV